MKVRTNISLDPRQTAALDEAAEERGISRAKLVRQVIEKGIGASAAGDLEADLAAIDASFGALRATNALDALERGPDDRSRHLQNVASRRASRR
ncbi:MAG: ribbon-helix-helix protein, CopG family [Candidatus Dormibacteria bacterium]